MAPMIFAEYVAHFCGGSRYATADFFIALM